MGAARRPRLRSFAAKLALVLVSVAFALLLAEGALQLMVPRLRPRFTRAHPTLGWTHEPSLSHLEELHGRRYRLSYNAHGYRAPEHALQKPPGTFRVVVLGDSFVDASEVDDEETFTRVLERSLSGVEVVNLGVWGYSTAQEALTLEQVAFRFDPDLVLLVTAPNDFSDNLVNLSSYGPAPRMLLAGSSLRLELPEHPDAAAAFRSTNLPAPRSIWLHQHSYVYHLLNTRIYQRLRSKAIVAERDAQQAALGADERTELYRRIVGKMRGSCEERGVKFTIAFIHEKQELSLGASPRAALVQSLKAEGHDVVDLFEPLKAADRGGGRLYFAGDIHFNAEGHRLLAALLKPEVRGRYRVF